MRALSYIEIDMPICGLTFGTSPCTATGDRKCCNSRATCLDLANIDEETVTFRFAEDCGYLPRQIEAIPSVIGISMSPAVLAPGEGLGVRASCNVQFADHPYADTAPGFDKYFADRDFDPYLQGTFWPKFRARHPFVRGKKLRIIRGFVPASIASDHPFGSPLPANVLQDQETRHYVIDSIGGDAAKGVFQLSARDVLKIADDNRAQAPRMSSGRLSADLSSSATSFTLTPTGIGNAEYPASGHVAIGGKEIVSFTRSGDTMTITRAQKNTAAQAFSSQERVQLVLSYSTKTVDFIINDLLQNYTEDFDSSYIPLSTWGFEIETYLNSVFSADIAEPTPVNKLIEELVQICSLAIWQDEISQQIQLRVLRAVAPSAETFTTSDYLNETLSINEQPDKRISDVISYFAKRDPLKKLDDTDNYRSADRVFDADSYMNYGPSIKKIYNRWIPLGGRAINISMAERILARLNRPIRMVKFDVWRTHAKRPELGAGYFITSPNAQNDLGEPEVIPILVTSLQSTKEKYSVEAVEIIGGAEAADLIDRKIYIDTNVRNINLRILHDALYPEVTDADVIGGVNLTVYILSGVRVGSNSVTLPAFDVGSWPDDFPIVIEWEGRVSGAGGKGKNANSQNYIGPNTYLQVTGERGGTAFYTRHPVTLNFSADAECFAGGGGGPAATAINPGYPSAAGGGGAGDIPGAGGTSPIGLHGATGTDVTGGDAGLWYSIYALPAAAGGDAGQPSSRFEPWDPWGFGDAAPPGEAIDGVSFCTINDGGADIRGPQVN
jgi:hypothetical protein